MVVSQVCPGAALEYWPGVVRVRLVKNDIFSAKNTNVYWYGGGGGAGQNFQPVKISPRKVVIIGEFPRLPGTLHMAGDQILVLLLFPTLNPRSEPTTTDYFQTCFWLELISFINSNQTTETAWEGMDGNLTFIDNWEANTKECCRVRQQDRSYFIITNSSTTKPYQTGCLETAHWKNTKRVLGKFMQMQILCFYHGFHILYSYCLVCSIVYMVGELRRWRWWRWWRWWRRRVITENYFIGSGWTGLVILVIAGLSSLSSLLISIRLTIVKLNYLSSKKYTDKIRLEAT